MPPVVKGGPCGHRHKHTLPTVGDRTDASLVLLVLLCYPFLESLKQASLALAYPQAWVEQKGMWLQWQQQAPSLAQQLSEQGGGPGGYIAPQAARHPLSASALNNPHQKASFTCLGRGGPACWN